MTNIFFFRLPEMKELYRSRFLLLLLLGLPLGFIVTGCQRKTPEVLLAEAEDALMKNDVLSAEMKFEDILKKNPPPEFTQRAHFGLAVCKGRDKDFDAMRDHLNQVIKITGGPQSEMGMQALNMKIESYLAQQKPDLALKEALATSDSLRLAPLQNRIHFQIQIARLYLINQQEGKTRELLEGVVRQYPEDYQLHDVALEGLSSIPAKGKKWREAIQIYEDYLTTYSQSPLKAKNHQIIAMFQKELGDETSAAKSYDISEDEWRKQIEKALGADEKAGLLQELAKVQEERGNVDQSSRTLQTILEKYPVSQSRPVVKAQMAGLAMRKRDVQRAIRILEEIAREYPDTQWEGMARQNIGQIQALMAQAQTSGTLNRMFPTTGTLPADSALPGLTTRTLMNEGMLPPSTDTTEPAQDALLAPAGDSLTTGGEQTLP